MHEEVAVALSDRVRGWMDRVEDPLLWDGIRYPYHERASKDVFGADE